MYGTGSAEGKRWKDGSYLMRKMQIFVSLGGFYDENNQFPEDLAVICGMEMI